MFCPRCRSEYRAGFARCADCGIALVPQLSDQAPDRGRLDEIGWVEVYATFLEERNVVVKALLDGEGVPYSARGDFVRFAGFHPEPVRFFVPLSEANRAQDLLAKLSADEG